MYEIIIASDWYIFFVDVQYYVFLIGKKMKLKSQKYKIVIFLGKLKFLGDGKDY